VYGRRFYNSAIMPEQFLNNFGIDWKQKVKYTYPQKLDHELR